MKRSRTLRRLLSSKETTILMEAHNGLTAKLVEEAGFEAVWGSGLAISAALGVRDRNEASWTQVLEVLEFMADATELPILADGDTGYGDFNNVRRLVRKLEQRGVAGVCVEDKVFPKSNSFLDGDRQRLADAGEFCGKIRAAKDSQRAADFVFVARTEAIVLGRGVGEAVERAAAYAAAGADAVLAHCKSSGGGEVLDFMRQWDSAVPVVIVPTMYPAVPLPVFEEAGVGNFIFANQGLRTVITALQLHLGTLRRTRDLMSIEREIAPVAEIFRLQDVAEVRAAEERYLSPDGGDGETRDAATVAAGERR